MRPVRISGALAALAVVLLTGAPAAAQGPYPPGIDADSIRIATVGSASIAAGGAHSCAITSVGELFCWGDDSSGQVGDGAGAHEAGLAVPVLADAVQVDAGRAHTCAVTVNGAAYCWGDGEQGQLGDGAGADRDAPAAVAALSDRVLVEITTGARHSCAIDDEGSAWCWGDGTHGQLGVPGLRGSAVPVRVATQPGPAGKQSGATAAGKQSGVGGPFVDIAAGGDATCAVTAAGGAFCWGADDSAEPVAVSTAIVAREIVVGGTRACALDTAGRASCWGIGGPAESAAAGPFDQLAAGREHTCGLDRNGRARCWGEGADGRLGTGGTADEDAPAAVDLETPLRDLDAGDRHTCAFDVRGYAWCWGAGADGRLGTGDTAASAVPVRVVGLPRAPAAATGIRVLALDGGLRVSWLPPADLGSGAFLYYWATTAGYEAGCTIEDVTATGCELAGLENGRTYDVAVIVLTRDGLTVSDFVTAAPRSGAPPPVNVPVPPTLVLQPGPGGGLPVTGVSPIALVALGTLLLGTGLAALLVRKQ